MSVHYAHRVNVIEEPRSMYSHKFFPCYNQCVCTSIRERGNEQTLCCCCWCRCCCCPVFIYLSFFYSSQIEWEHTRNAYYEISHTHSHRDACVCAVHFGNNFNHFYFEYNTSKKLIFTHVLSSRFVTRPIASKPQFKIIQKS